MAYPTREEVESLRKRFPIGSRIKLIYMDDIQAPPLETLGTVRGVDDLGNILVSWDTGSSLSIIPDKDQFKKI